MNEDQALKALAALSNQTRLRIVKHLVTCGAQGQAAGEIGEAVGALPSRASFHLAALERAGLVSAQRVSRQIVYQASYAQLGGLLGYILVDCCRNDPQVRSMSGVDSKSDCCQPSQT